MPTAAALRRCCTLYSAAGFDTSARFDRDTALPLSNQSPWKSAVRKIPDRSIEFAVRLNADRIRLLAVEGDVEALLFGGLIDFHARNEVNQPQRHPREDERVGAAQYGCGELLA